MTDRSSTVARNKDTNIELKKNHQTQQSEKRKLQDQEHQPLESPKKKQRSSDHQILPESISLIPKKSAPRTISNPEYPRLGKSNKYKTFFNEELYQFLEGPTKTDLRGSYVSCLSSVYKPAQRAKSPLLGTFWSAIEKELFFEFLGRYGISQIDRIKQHLPYKSLLEIMNYYDLLQKQAESYKKKKLFFMKLVRYDEIPQAMEVDETALMIEESLVDNLVDEESWILSRDFKRQESLREEYIEKDDEDKLINMPVLDSLCEFYSRDHLKELVQDPMIQYGFRFITNIIHDLIKDIILDILEKKAYYSTNAKFYGSNIKEEEDGGVLSFKVHKSEVFESLNNIIPKRPNSLYKYMANLEESLGFTYVFDKNDDIKEQEDILDEFLNRLKESKIKSRNRERNEFHIPKPNEENHIKGSGSFVIDDEESDSMLDYKTALKVTYIESDYVENIDQEESKNYQNWLLSRWGHEKTYENLITRDHENYRYNYFDKLLKNIKGKEDKFDEPSIEEILVQLDESDLKEIDDQDFEITEEMIYLYSLTFEKYKK